MLAGNPALDLANTLHWRGSKQLEFVADYRSLVDWAEVALLLTEAEKSRLAKSAAQFRDEANEVHAQWLELRGALKKWLPSVNGRATSKLQRQVKSRAAKNVFKLIASSADNTLLSSFYGNAATDDGQISLNLPLLRSANAIWSLMSLRPNGIIRQCEADSCGGYFIDQSRAKPRRWCSMDSCGNRAKSARHRDAKAG